MRAAKLGGVAVALLLLVTAALLAWITGTQSGTRFALNQAARFAPEGIDLGRATGRLGGDLALDNVAVTLDTLELTLSRLRLAWSPSELLRGRLHIVELSADGVRYRALAAEQPEESREPFTLPERFELPLALRLERLAVTDIEIIPGPEAEPVSVARVSSTDVTFEDSRFDIEQLEVDSPLLSAQGAMSATAAGDYPVDVDLAWQLNPTGYAPLDGATRLGGSLADLRVEQRVAEPYGVLLRGEVSHLTNPQRTLHVSLALDAEDVRLPDIREGLPAASFSLDARAEGPVDDLAVEVRANGADAERRRFEAVLSAVVAPESVVVEELVVRQPEREGELIGAGRLALAEEITADLVIRWSALRWPLAGEPTLVSPRGTLEVTGPPSAYRLNLDTRLEPVDAPAVNIRVDGSGDLAAAELDLEAQTEGGRLEGSLEVAWDPDVQARISLRTSRFDPSALMAGWPGEVNLALDASARAGDDDLAVTVSRLDADGVLRDQALTVAARGGYRQQAGRHRVDVERLDAELGDTRLHVGGRIEERADLEWRLDSRDLSTVWPELEGTVSGSGRVSGPLPRVRVEADVEGSGVAYAEHRLASFDLDADVDLSGENVSGLMLTARDGSVGGSTVDSLVVEGGGTPQQHRLSLDLDADPLGAGLELEGRALEPWGENPAWAFDLREGELAYAGLAPWRLVDGASGLIAAERARLERHCWEAADERICLGGQRDADGLAARLDLETLRFAYFAPLLPEDVVLEGALEGYAEVSQPADGALTASADLRTTAGSVTLPAVQVGAPAATLQLQPSRLLADVNPDEARAQAELYLEEGRLSLEVATSATLVAAGDEVAAGRPLTDQVLDGTVTIDIPDLAFVSDLVAQADEVEGHVEGTLQLGGTLGEPALSGSIGLEEGSVFVPEPGITVSELAVTLEGLGQEGVGLTASARSGDGSLSLNGRMSLPGDGLDASLDVQGDAFEVMDNDEGRVFLSPDLNVDADAERITITGHVHVPRAELTPGTRAPSAITPSEDQVLVSDTPDGEAAQGRDLFAEIRLTLGDEVHFDGFGLTARIDGNVLIDQEPDTPTTATGELTLIDGEYRAYGQGLVIDEGRIYFAGGPVTQPALDVRAVRRPREDIVVGARVQGTLQEPTFELFSEPPMSQQEQLSYLVLGRSLEETPDGQENALSRAALAMGLKGGDFLARNIGEQVGVDEIGIETGSGEAGAPSDPAEAALVVGKYLSPRLYVSYGIGLFDPESVLEMQYEISRNWTLVTQSSGDATGADVLYTVEVGGN